MAQRALKQPDAQHIDEYLNYLLREWRMLDWVASEWDSWEEHERLDFVIEWPIREDRLLQFCGWEDQGLLTSDQRKRYAVLLELIEEQRPTVNRLLAD